MEIIEQALLILGDLGENAQTLRLLDRCINELVPFVGAGLSADFDYPEWKNLLQNMATIAGLSQELDILLSQNDYEKAAELLQSSRPKLFNQTLLETFDDRKLPRPLGKGAVRHLPRIARGPVLTTNFDRVIERAFEDAGRRFGDIFNGSEVLEATRALSLNEPYLLKLHGDYAHSSTRVFTLSDYSRGYGDGKSGVLRDRPLTRVLSLAVGSKHLLFLGCSLDTDRTTVVIAQSASDWPGTVHFALLSENSNTPERLRKLDEWNIKPLFYPRGRYEKIEELLGCLANVISPDTPDSREARSVRFSQGAEKPNRTQRRFLTSFVGRQGELAALQKLLCSRTALITITGAAGSGKTRLALEAIDSIGSAFSGDIYYIPLDVIRDHNLVLAEIAARLSIKEALGSDQTLSPPNGAEDASSRGSAVASLIKQNLPNRRVLLCLDNFEHVLEAAAQLSDLLAGSPGLTMLITSRELLRIQGEYEVSLPPLSLPGLETKPTLEELSGFSAVELFVQRARAVNTGFGPKGDEIETVTAICRKLDGLPLAIELAAAKLRSYSLDSLLLHLDQRLQFLDNGPRDLPQRQRTLRAAIAWSYDLLSLAEKTLLTQVAVFVGGAEPVAIAAICDPSGDLKPDPEQILASLTEKNLLRQQVTTSGPRFMLFESIRDFALDALEASEKEELLSRHEQFFVDAAEHMLWPVPGTRPPGPGEVRDWLEAEIGNLRLVLDAGVARSDVRVALPLTVRMRPFWLDLGHVSEGRRRLLELVRIQEESAQDQQTDSIDFDPMEFWRFRRKLEGLSFGGSEAPDDLDLWLIDATRLAALLASMQNDYKEARALLEKLRQMGQRVGSEELIGDAILPLGLFPASSEGGQVPPGYDDSLRHFRESGDPRRVGLSLMTLGLRAKRSQDLAGAETYLQQSLDIFTEIKDVAGIVYSRSELAEIKMAKGDIDEAVLLAQEALQAARIGANPILTAITLCKAGQMSAARGNLRAASAEFGEALAISEETGNRWAESASLFHLGRLALQMEQAENAKTYLERAARIQRAMGSNAALAETLYWLGAAALALGHRPAQISESREIFRSLRDKAGEARWVLITGEGDLRMANYEEALKKFQEARALFEEAKDPMGVANSTMRIAQAHRERGEYAESQKLYEQALRLFQDNKADAAAANCLRAMGDLYRKQGDHEKARAQNEEALKMHRALNNKSAAGSLLLALGDLNVDLRE